MKQRLVIGNWKLNGSLAVNLSLLHALRRGSFGRGGRVQVAVCVPYVYIPQARAILNGSSIAWGGQDVSCYEDGAYTGEVSAGMLADFACRYVLVGHSERRTLFGERNTEVAVKAKRALAAGLVPVVCVGESLAERESGCMADVVLNQLDAVVEHCGAEAMGRCVIAYEPVWAIGTGLVASPDQAQEVHALIRARLALVGGMDASKVPILYGGSVKPESAAKLFAERDVDGGLIGGASLNAADFLAICAA